MEQKYPPLTVNQNQSPNRFLLVPSKSEAGENLVQGYDCEVGRVIAG